MMKQNLLIINLTNLLSTCNFQLRNTNNIQFTLKKLNISAHNTYNNTIQQIREILENNNMHIYASAPYKLMITHETKNRHSTNYNNGTRTTKYELTITLDYEIRNKQNLLLTNNKIKMQNYYQQNNNNLTNSDQETTQLHSKLHHEMIQQLTQNLQQITPTQLDQLQQTTKTRTKTKTETLKTTRHTRESQIAPQQSPIS